MESGLKRISELFDGTKKFTIPVYQRPYSWEENQLKDFLEDIENHPRDQKYFFGTILIREAGKDNNDFEILEVVDGQQRLTTLSIFISLLIQNLKENGASLNTEMKEEKFIKYHGNHKLQLAEDNNEFFQNYIIKTPSTIAQYQNPAQERLKNAKEFFAENFQKEQYQDLDRLTNILSIIENAEVLVYSVNGSAEASLIFEITNDRGKSLTRLEKLKSFLMFKATSSNLHGAEELINNLNSQFGNMYRVVERLKSKPFASLAPIGEDSIPQYYFIAFEDWSRKKEYQNYLQNVKGNINAFRKEKEQVGLLIANVSKRLRESFDTFEMILNENNAYLKEIFYLGRVAPFLAIILKSYYLDEHPKKINYNKILKVLSIFSFRVFALKFRRTSDIDLNLHRTANEFKGDFDWLETTLKSKVNEIAPDRAFANKLRSPNFHQEFNNGDKNFFFWKYENQLRSDYQPKSSTMSVDSLFDKDPELKITIEHVSAQQPKNDLQIEERGEPSEDDYLHSIGNLTIDPKSANSSKGNDLWEDKNSKYFSKAPFKTQLELSDIVDSKSDGFKTWDHEAIKVRQERIIEEALKIWKV